MLRRKRLGRSGGRVPARRQWWRMVLPAAVLLVSGAAVHFARGQDSSAVAGIPASALFSERDLQALIRVNAEEWLAPSAEQIAARSAEPEDPGMRANFSTWLRFVLAPQWLPSTVPASTPYLKVGGGRESRAFSCFYAAYQVDGQEFMAKGYAGRVIVTILPLSPVAGPSAKPLFAEARSRQQTIPAGKLGVPQSAPDAAPALEPLFRGLTERYVNPSARPRPDDWAPRLHAMDAYNGGYLLSWPTNGYQDFLPREWNGERSDALCSLWTNGVVVRLTLEVPFRINPTPNLLASVPKPVSPPVAPLNPQAVYYLDQCEWYDETSAPVSDSSRAAYTVIRIVVREPYAPKADPEGEFRETGGQFFLGSQVRLPMTDLKWRVAEFAALVGATEVSLSGQGGPEDPEAWAAALVTSSDRGRLLDEARARRDSRTAVADRFAALKYPQEVGPEREALLRELRAAANAWDTAIAFWEPRVQNSGGASAEFFRTQNEQLLKQLRDAGLENTSERISKAANVGVQLLKRFGLED